MTLISFFFYIMGNVPMLTLNEQDNSPLDNFPCDKCPRTIPTEENCPKIIAPGQFPPRIIDPLDR